MIEVTVKDETPEMMQKLQAAVSRFVRKGAGYIKGQLKGSMNEPKSGRKYKRGKDGVHVASAPGESPAVDSSNYVDSLQLIFENSLEAKIGTPLEYPLFLEEGTDNIEPRPLWERTVKDVLPTLEMMLQQEIRGV